MEKLIIKEEIVVKGEERINKLKVYVIDGKLQLFISNGSRRQDRRDVYSAIRLSKRNVEKTLNYLKDALDLLQKG